MDVKITRQEGSDDVGYVCPECKVWSPASTWREGEIGGCEICGEHSAMICPACDEFHDQVYTSFEDAERFLKDEAEAKAKADRLAAQQAAREAFEASVAPLKVLKARIQTADRHDDGELVSEIAEVALGWKPTPVPREIEEDVACEVLTQTGDMYPGFRRSRMIYDRWDFIPRTWESGPFTWLSSIEDALGVAKEILKPDMGLMWSRDAGGRFTISNRNPLERWGGSSRPHVATDALAILDAAIAAEIDKRRSAAAHTWKDRPPSPPGGYPQWPSDHLLPPSPTEALIMATYWRKPTYLPTDRDPITREILPHAIPPGIYCENEDAFRALQRGARTRGRPILATAGGGWELYGERIFVATPAQAEFFRAVAAPAGSEPEPDTSLEEAAAKITALMGGQPAGASSPVQAAAPPPRPQPKGPSRAIRRAAASEARRRA